MSRLIDALLDVIWPRLCPCCGRVLMQAERIMCLHCRVALPLTNFHLWPTDNALRDKLNGLVPVVRATAYFHYYRQSPHAALIHDAKYREHPSLAQNLAEEYAQTIAPSGFFDEMDAIVPVPLNFWKLCARGYNQSAYIAKGIARVANIPIVDALKARHHSTQTLKGVQARQQNAEGIYSAMADVLRGLHHILLVDDVATTGATLYACAKAIHQAAPSAAISVLTLADAQKV